MVAKFGLVYYFYSVHLETSARERERERELRIGRHHNCIGKAHENRCAALEHQSWPAKDEL